MVLHGFVIPKIDDFSQLKNMVSPLSKIFCWKFFEGFSLGRQPKPNGVVNLIFHRCKFSAQRSRPEFPTWPSLTRKSYIFEQSVDTVIGMHAIPLHLISEHFGCVKVFSDTVAVSGSRQMKSSSRN